MTVCRWIDHNSSRLQEAKVTGLPPRTFELLSDIITRRGGHMADTMTHAAATLQARQELILVVSTLTRSNLPHYQDENDDNTPPPLISEDGDVDNPELLCMPRVLIDIMASYVTMQAAASSTPTKSVRSKRDISSTEWT
jgi:hypothetical protein